MQKVTSTRSVNEEEAVRRLDIGVERGPRRIGMRRDRGWVSNLARSGAVELVRIEESHSDRHVAPAVDGESVAGITCNQEHTQ